MMESQIDRGEDLYTAQTSIYQRAVSEPDTRKEVMTRSK